MAIEQTQRVSSSELTLILIFQVFVEAIYFLLGVRMDIFPLLGYWQLIDPLLLKTDLLRSVFYLHIQPPGFNLLVGVIMKIFPASYPFAFQGLYFIIGILALWSLFTLEIRFGVSKPIALVTTLLFSASPGYVLFEHHLLYTFLIASSWIISALMLHNYLIYKKFRSLLAFFAILLFMAWTRALIHILYIVIILSLLLWKTRPITRKHIIAALILLVLVLAPYVKNQLVFGKFTQSTWFPGNLAKVTTFPISFKKRLQLYHDHEISMYSAYIWRPNPKEKDKKNPDETFNTHTDERGNPFWSSPEFLKPYENLPHIPILFSRLKSTSTAGNPYPNINYVGMIGTYNKVMKDDIILALKFPYVVLTSWCYSFLIYTMPSHIQGYLSEDNKKAAKPIIHLYDMAYGKVKAGFMHTIAQWLERNWDYVPFINPEHIYLTLIFGLPFLLFYGIRTYRRRRTTSDKVLLLYILTTIIFVMLIGNMADCGENNRFRFLTDFMYVFLSGLALQGLITWLHKPVHHVKS